MFDPDYRTSPWNRSRFAPKNGGSKSKNGKGNGITRDAMMPAIAIISLIFCGLLFTGTFSSNSITLLIIVGAISFIITPFYARHIREKEYNRLMGYNSKKSKSEPYPFQSSEPYPFDTPRIRDETFDFDTASELPPSIRNLDNSTLDPSVFEQEIAWLINVTTKYTAKVVGGSGDGGVDVEVFDNHNIRVGIVQCKRHSPDKPLSPLYVRELFAVKKRLNVPIAYLATTAYFTDNTRSEAEEYGIRLLDGKAIRRMQKKAHNQAFNRPKK